MGSAKIKKMYNHALCLIVIMVFTIHHSFIVQNYIDFSRRKGRETSSITSLLLIYTSRN